MPASGACAKTTRILSMALRLQKKVLLKDESFCTRTGIADIPIKHMNILMRLYFIRNDSFPSAYELQY
jgi:hypothetical protein